MDITKNGHTTVIITTHYIDECAQAHVVSSHAIFSWGWSGKGVEVGVGAERIVSMAFWRPRIVCSLDL